MKRNLTLLFTLAALSGLLILGQGCGKPTMQKANELKDSHQYRSAGDMYKRLASSKKLTKEERALALQLSAESFFKSYDYRNAKRAYERILRNDKNNAEALYFLGLIALSEAAEKTSVNEYREARKYFERYLKEVPGDERAIRRMISCDSAESWLGQESRYEIENFREVNTKYNDFSPSVADKKDNALVFVSDRDGGMNKRTYGGSGNFFSDIWIIEKERARRGVEKWGKPKLLPGEVNTKFNDGVQDFDRRFSTMYFTRCNGGDGKSPFCKIYEAQKRGNEWVNVTILSFCEEDSANYVHPAISPDGSKLFFSSDREGGYGGYDLYVVNFIKRGKTWSDPINLGPTINTQLNEEFPYYNQHDDHLYFSSDGHVGMGGLDIYKTQGSGQEWTEPENLKFPMNTGADDFGITFLNNDPNSGFFSSSRSGGRGMDDIYMFYITPLEFRLVGTVTDCKTGMPLPNSLVEITSEEDTTKYSFRTDEDGNYDTVMLLEEATYQIMVSNREAYYFDAEDAPRTISTVGLKQSKLFIEDFCLNPQLDFARVLPIFYRLDKADIDPPAAAVLKDSLLPLLLKYPAIRIELGSHTDCRSSYAYNISLSQRRADSAVAFLVRKGIDPRRIVAKGYGESQLLNDCACEGREVTRHTPYEIGSDPLTGQPRYAKKQDIVNNQYVYIPYKPNEIVEIEGVKYVPCDEYQHRQNRRTTIRILDVNFDSSVALLPDDANNQNQQMVILKLDKDGELFKGSASANGASPVGHTIFHPKSNKIEISLVELKNLVDKKKITPDDVIGATPQQIMSGAIPDGAKLKVKSLLIGDKGLGKTYQDLELEISSFKASFRIGLPYLEKEMGATFEEEEGELALTAINREAIEIPKDAALSGKEKERDLDAIEGVVKLPITMKDEVPTISIMVNDKEAVTFAFDISGRNTWMDPSSVAVLYDNGVLSKRDFYSGSKVKVDGIKVPGTMFTVDKLEAKSIAITNTKFKMSDKAPMPELGRVFFKNFQEAIVKDNFLYLVPKPERKSRK